MMNLKKYIDSPIPSVENAAKLAVVLGIFFTPIGTAPANIFCALAIIFWFAAGGYKKRFEDLKVNYLAGSTLALIFIIVIGSTYSSADFNDIYFQLTKYSKLFLILIVISLFKEKKWRDLGVNAFAASMLITLLLSLGSVFLSIPLVKGGAGNHYVFKDHIAQNLMMSFFVILMLTKSFYETRVTVKLVYLFVAVIAAVDILFLVQGRTGYFSLLLGLLILAGFFFPMRRWPVLIIAGTLCVSGVFYFSDNFSSRLNLAVLEYKNQESNELTSVGQRVEFFKKSIVLIKERPLFGWGTGAYGKEFCRVAISPEWCQAGKAHPHNQFLSFGVQFGILGIIFYLAFLGSIVKAAEKFDSADKALLIGLLGILIVDSFFHAPLFLVAEAQFFILMLGILSAGSLVQKNHGK
jgi:O-antigen ligase